MSSDSAADLIGYGAHPPNPQWPQDARIAVQFVLNYEVGGEDQLKPGFEYGSRAGVWRVLRLAQEFGIPLTIFAVAMALERHPALARELVGLGHEIASQGWRWIDYPTLPAQQERADMHRAIEVLTRVTGSRPLGWYTGRPSANARKLVIDEGGFLYDADADDDDLPYWVSDAGRHHLVVPYTLDVNDMKLGADFFPYARDAFDSLYAEGATAPKMLSIGLHTHVSGRPARITALRQLFAHMRAHRDVWFCRRIDIARHWIENHPPD